MIRADALRVRLSGPAGAGGRARLARRRPDPSADRHLGTMFAAAAIAHRVRRARSAGGDRHRGPLRPAAQPVPRVGRDRARRRRRRRPTGSTATGGATPGSDASGTAASTRRSATLVNTVRWAESVGHGICLQVSQGNDTDSYGRHGRRHPRHVVRSRPPRTTAGWRRSTTSCHARRRLVRTLAGGHRRPHRHPPAVDTGQLTPLWADPPHGRTWAGSSPPSRRSPPRSVRAGRRLAPPVR